MLKSELMEIYDFNRVVIPDELLNIEINGEVIEEAIDDLCHKYLTIEEVYDGIKHEDVISACFESNIPKYNKRHQIVVGKEYFDKDIEAELVGMKKGDLKEISPNGEPVKIKILSVKRRMVPIASDELVKKEKIDGVSNIEEYKSYAYENAVAEEKKIRMRAIIDYYEGEIINNSKFYIESGEVDSIYKGIEEEISKEAEDLNISFEENLVAAASGYIENPDVEKSKEMFMDWSNKSIKTILLGQAFAKEFGIVLNHDTYEKDIVAGAKRHKISIERMKEFMNYYRYLETKYEPQLIRVIKDFCKGKIEFIVKSM